MDEERERTFLRTVVDTAVDGILTIDGHGIIGSANSGTCSVLPPRRDPSRPALPDICGNEVLRRLKADVSTADIPVLIISADATPSQIEKLLERGAYDYLTEPLELQRFVDLMGVGGGYQLATQNLSKSEHWQAKILAVDDNPANLELILELLTEAGYTNVTTLSEPSAAIDLVLRRNVDLMLLDLHMPSISGFDILHVLRDSVGSESLIPVLVCTADCTPEARKKALDLGASDFITKPYDVVELLLRVRNFLRMRQLHLELRNRNASLELEVGRRTSDLVQARTEALLCLARAAEYRDDSTGQHVKRVGELSARIAYELGIESDLAEKIRLAAQLHDVGKIGIPDAILLKPGKYDDAEFQEMKRHTVMGHTIIGECTSPLLVLARQIALHHHENWDGTGYPSGLSRKEIPITCRIVAAADMYDALTHERPYKKAWTRGEALEEIRSQSGKRLDPEVVAALDRL